MGRFWSLFLVLFCFYVFFFDKGELIVFITTVPGGWLRYPTRENESRPWPLIELGFYGPCDPN